MSGQAEVSTLTAGLHLLSVASSAAAAAASSTLPLHGPYPTPFEGIPPTDEDEYPQDEGGSAALTPKYLKELELCQMLGQLREKPEWWLKVNQPLIVNRWKKEMYEQSTLLTPQTIEFGIQELKYQSQLYQKTTVKGHTILPSAIDGVYQNDQLISPELQQQLKECLKPFEDVPESERDYHPGSDKQVIDLVHPSLYCLRIGETKLTKAPVPLKDTLRSIGSGEIASEPPKDSGDDYATSKKYAWLPAEFEVSPDSSKVNIASYINNIHPLEHAKLYEVLAAVFAPFIPMFEKVLTNLQSPLPSRMNNKDYYWFSEPKEDKKAAAAFQAHLDREREALKVASKGQAKFYLDVVHKDSFGPNSAQFQATMRLGLLVHPDMKLSKSSQFALIQFQDRLARFYLESTFEAFTKTEGLLTTDNTIKPDTDFTQPPFLSLYAPAAVLSKFGELLKHSRIEMTKAVIKSKTERNGGLVFKEPIARRWFVLFKRRLPNLFPQMDAAIREQYCQLFLKKEFANLIRLCAVAEYFTAEIAELGGNAARDFRLMTIELFHINLAIKGDEELLAMDNHLKQLYPSNAENDTVVDDDETTEREIAVELAKMVDEDTEALELAELEEEEDKNAEDYEDDEEDEEDGYHSKVQQPEVPFPFTPEIHSPQSTISLAGRTLQVIVKLANIELTPEKPTYNGGAWHVEGMNNEAIVASGIYYINSTNITESRLSFRQGVKGFEPEQDDSKGPREVYGLHRNGDLNQELGSLITKGGRAIAFPNIYQHQVQPFQLANPTQPGKRQILVFFLVDPTIRVTSTANVPPQQQHWLKSATGENTPTVLASMNTGTSLIPDLVNLTAEYSDLGLMTQKEACEVREELMKERKYFVDQNTQAVYQRQFSFCEH